MRERCMIIKFKAVQLIWTWNYYILEYTQFSEAPSILKCWM